jgi:hypothetical protein
VWSIDSNSLAGNTSDNKGYAERAGHLHVLSSPVSDALYLPLVFGLTRIVEQRSMSRGCIGSMDDVQELAWMDALPFGGLNRRRYNAGVLIPQPARMPHGDSAAELRLTEFVFFPFSFFCLCLAFATTVTSSK